MAFCRFCGSEVKDELDTCPFCNSPMPERRTKPKTVTTNEEKTSGNTQVNKKTTNQVQPIVKERSTLLMVILTFLTFGLFGFFYWAPSLANDMNKITKKNGTTGAQLILFTLLTCGLYKYLWYYKMGDLLYEIKSSNYDEEHDVYVDKFMGGENSVYDIFHPKHWALKKFLKSNTSRPLVFAVLSIIGMAWMNNIVMQNAINDSEYSE